MNESQTLYLTISLNPVIQRTLMLPDLTENEVNRSSDYRVDASGKGINVTRVLQQLGEPVMHLTQAGGHFRDYFLHLAEEDNLHVSWVESHSDIRMCTTLINKSRNTATEIVEEARPVKDGTEERIRRQFHQLIDETGVLILSGSKAPGFSDDLFPVMVEKAKSKGCRVILDYRGPDLINSLPFKPDIIKPNFKEFVNTFFPEMVPDYISTDIIRNKMLGLAKQGIITILTRGPDQILYVDRDSICTKSPPAITPINTIGCGDAFTAGFASVWTKTDDLEKAVEKGIECAVKNANSKRPGVIR